MANSKYKIVLLGESNVGKTSMVNRLLHDRYSRITDSTIGGAFSVKDIIVNEKTISLNIWDTAGQERYRSLTIHFYRNAVGCLCVFDVTDRKSYLMLETWLRLFKEGNESQKYVIIIVGNKSDIAQEKWQVTKKELELFARENQCEYILASCFNNENIHEAFEILAEKISEMQPETNMIDISNESENESEKIIIQNSPNNNYSCGC